MNLLLVPGLWEILVLQLVQEVAKEIKVKQKRAGLRKILAGEKKGELM